MDGWTPFNSLFALVSVSVSVYLQYLNCHPNNLEHSSLYTVHNDIRCKTHDTTQNYLFLRQSMQEMHSQYDEIENNHIGRQIIWSQDANGEKSLNWSECIWSCTWKKLWRNHFNFLSQKHQEHKGRIARGTDKQVCLNDFNPRSIDQDNQFEVAKSQAAVCWSAEKKLIIHTKCVIIFSSNWECEERAIARFKELVFYFGHNTPLLLNMNEPVWAYQSIELDFLFEWV